jgi:predicted nucleic acid-binding protein
MTKGIAVDTNAVVEYVRDREYPRQLDGSDEVFLPLTVVGELFYGVALSNRPEYHRGSIARIIKRWPLLIPDIDTSRIYGDMRATASRTVISLRASKINDFWIAALCVQHALSILTNDGGFDNVPGLTVIHW